MKDESEFSRDIGKADFESKIGNTATIHLKSGGSRTGKVVLVQDQSVMIEELGPGIPTLAGPLRGRVHPTDTIPYSEMTNVRFG